MRAVFLLLLVSACALNTREDFDKTAIDVASMEFGCHPREIRLNSVKEERSFWTQRMTAMNYEASGCGRTKLYRASDEHSNGVIAVKDHH